MGRKLFVGNLSYNTDERRLEEIFQAIGPVDSVNIVRDQMTGRARGFAFVEMQTDEAAQSAIQKLNETDLDGRKIAVNEARPKPQGDRGGRPAAAVVAAARVVANPAGSVPTPEEASCKSPDRPRTSAPESAPVRKNNSKRRRAGSRRASATSRKPSSADGEDPDIAGIIPGPQPSPWGDEQEEQ